MKKFLAATCVAVSLVSLTGCGNNVRGHMEEQVEDTGDAIDNANDEAPTDAPAAIAKVLYDARDTEVPSAEEPTTTLPDGTVLKYVAKTFGKGTDAEADESCIIAIKGNTSYVYQSFDGTVTKSATSDTCSPINK